MIFNHEISSCQVIFSAFFAFRNAYNNPKFQENTFGLKAYFGCTVIKSSMHLDRQVMTSTLIFFSI